jgi:hypothetical protein
MVVADVCHLAALWIRCAGCEKINQNEEGEEGSG